MRIRNKGVVRPLDPNDPRNPKHPNHRENLLKLADAVGKEMAKRDFARIHSEGTDTDVNEEATDRRDLRKVLKRPPEGLVD